ncbi:MAG: hypothetical protein IJ234_02775 [Clostridia bacterium]|nr:hypothetical protein [Clostridia bacterium]
MAVSAMKRISEIYDVLLEAEDMLEELLEDERDAQEGVADITSARRVQAIEAALEHADAASEALEAWLPEA